MEKKKRTIITIASVIALAMAILGCGVLLGCGEKPKGGEKGSTIEPSPWPTGVRLGAKIEEKDEYDIDDVSLELLYGINISMFNSCELGWSVKDENEDRVKRKLSIIAYNDTEYDMEYFDVSKPILYDTEREKLYDDLSALEVGTANERAYLIEDIPFTIEEFTSDGTPKNLHSCTAGEVYQYMSADNLRGTEYEYTFNDNREITFYKKIDITLPRELFTNDDGYIFVDIAVLIEDNRNEKRNAYAYGLSIYGETVRFRYVKKDGKIVLTYYELGLPHFVDGTTNATISKTV